MLKGLFFLLPTLVLVSCVSHGPDFERSAAVRSNADLVLTNGKVVTVDPKFAIHQAVAIKDGRFVAVGTEREARLWTGPGTRVVNVGGRTVIPGLIDSHIHASAAGLSWDSELHWESTRSLANGLKQIAEAAKSRPTGQWIVVGGGWVPSQFVERRPPTRAELDAVAPGHPVYVQYLRQAAVLNSAALAVVGINRETPDPRGGRFGRNPATGEPTGVLQGMGAWRYAYDKIPRPSFDGMRQSFQSFFRELNRLGLTTVDDLQTDGITFAERRLLSDMARTGQLTLRLNYYVAPNDPEDELDQFQRVSKEVKQLVNNDMFHFAGFAPIRGTGDDDVLSNPQGMTIGSDAREKFRKLLRFFAESGYNFQLQATYDKTARQLLDIVEEVNREVPFSRQRIVFAHLEDAASETIDRIKKIRGAISIQDRLVLTGELNAELWGAEKARGAPPLRTMIDSGVPLGAGSEGFRAGNYSPMLSLWWLVTGKTVAGTAIRDRSQNVSREEALRMYTIGSAWLTFDEARRGSIEVGKLADLAVLSADYLTVPEDQIPKIESLLTIVGGRVVFSAVPFMQVGTRKPR
jgi:predicted amidohydrolase YtcJ